jgi:ubiquinone biosynthesis protein COQ9
MKMGILSRIVRMRTMSRSYSHYLQTERKLLLAAVLKNVPFDGWTERAIIQGAADSGYDDSVRLRAFPGGAGDVIEYWSVLTDQEMVDELLEQEIQSLKVRERITKCVRWRLEALSPHREAKKRAMSYLGQPQNIRLSLRLLYSTVDEMWRISGDTATDFNFYTKRGLLAGVYISTLLFWLEDDSKEFNETWSYLNRRIENVLSIPKVQKKFSKISNTLPKPHIFMYRLRDLFMKYNRY